MTKIEELQKVFNQAVADLTEAFEGLKAEIINVDEPEYKTVKRAAKVGERILITGIEEGKEPVFVVRKVNSRGDVDVIGFPLNIRHYHFSPDDYEVIIETEQDFNTEKRDAEVGDKILITNSSLVNAGEKGEVFTVTDNYEGFVDVEEIRATSNHWAFMPHEYEVIVGLEQAPFVEELPYELTLNEQRAELIQRAREFVEEHTIFNDQTLKGNRGFSLKVSGQITTFVVKPDFVINSLKRTVVVLLKGADNDRVIRRGIAKCTPGDVFNEWIGKAIALARALDIDVPEEFLDAVQPDEVVVGMKVKATSHDFESSFNHVVDIHSQFSVQQDFSQPNRSWFAVIINDTNAIYGGNPQ